MTDDEVIATLERMDSGELAFTCLGDVTSLGCLYGEVPYATATGRVVVYFKAGEWSYVDSITDVNGSTLWEFHLTPDEKLEDPSYKNASWWCPKNPERWEPAR